ncbi:MULTISPECIES: TonB-dependent receptor [Caulobacter]|jgi:iron complex outermembrane receptor protein|uniref:TonB-dependent receptor n=1 Tax=Caulobacter TaxID=75 RepID=UPI0007011D94|nr:MULTISPECIES: TonB-dependent receptor [Caulobacter]KQZ32024.1 TonB-dependent receptor [Caulobacter sp. Root1472]GGL42315.1 TonB-dependent receptor [Caulobacter rhizosphaerae]
MSRFNALKCALLLGAGLSALSFANAALAQEASSTALDEIVVTAERRSENLQKVPVSVAVVGGDQLRAIQGGGDDIISLSGKVPSFYAETTTGRIFPRFYIRGLGNIDFYLGASQPVSIIQDDVVLEHVVLKSNPVFDVKQVEVLRGPQGSLFGRNTTAGIVKFDTNKPTQTLEGRASASYGTYGTTTFDGGIGGPIVADKLAFRVSALYQHRDDYVDNTFAGASADGTVTPKKNAMGGFDEKDVRIQLLATPTEQLTVLASAHARNYEGTSTLFLRGALKKGSNSSTAPRDSVAFDEANNNPQAYDTQGTSLNIAYDFGPVTLTSISAYETTSGYSRGDTDGGAAANFPVAGAPNGFGQSMGQVRDLDQLTQEIRLASNGDDRLKWQVGALYFDSRDTTDFFQRAYFLTTAARNPNNWVELNNLNTSWAVFGQVSYKLTDALTVTGGLRDTYDAKKTVLAKTANTAANVSTYAGRRYVRLSDEQVSWDLSANYEVNPDLNLYARVAKGFRGPTIQGRSAVFNSDFTTANSETILSWEAGFKSTLLDNTLRLNASAFTYEVKDIQLNGNDSNGNGVLFNADKAKAYGLEADAEWRPIANLTLTAGVSLLHSEIKDKRVYAQVCALNSVVVCTVKNPTIAIVGPFGTSTFAQIDGQPLPNAPKYNLSFTGRYDVPVGADGKLFVATDWNVQGYTNFVLYKTDEFYSKGNFEGGLKLGYEGGNGAYEVALFGRNITNEKNLKGVIENYMAAVYNEPRIVGVSVSAKLK